MTVAGEVQFDEAEIREAEGALVAALGSPDPTAWVYQYTEDAVFDSGGDHVVEGREALLAMARSMTPLSSLQLEPLRTEGNAALATVWFKGSWVSGGSQEGTTVHVRGVLVWRKERDGRWRVALEHLG